MKTFMMLAEITATFWVAVAVGLLITYWLLGLVRIRETQVGIVIKKFAARSLPPGQLIARAGEAGYQADTLAPGLHFGYWVWQYRVLKKSVTVVPQGEIALVIAADGAAIPMGRILGKVADCDLFQDARKFLVNGGEKGRQLGILTAGISGWAAVWGTLKLVRTKSFTPFVIYRVLAGLAVLALYGARA